MPADTDQTGQVVFLAFAICICLAGWWAYTQGWPRFQDFYFSLRSDGPPPAETIEAPVVVEETPRPFRVQPTVEEQVRPARSSRLIDDARIPEWLRKLASSKRGIIIGPSEHGKTTILKAVARLIADRAKTEDVKVIVIDTVEGDAEWGLPHGSVYGGDLDEIYNLFVHLHALFEERVALKRASESFGGEIYLIIDERSNLIKKFDLADRLKPNGGYAKKGQFVTTALEVIAQSGRHVGLGAYYGVHGFQVEAMGFKGASDQIDNYSLVFKGPMAIEAARDGFAIPVKINKVDQAVGNVSNSYFIGNPEYATTFVGRDRRTQIVDSSVALKLVEQTTIYAPAVWHPSLTATQPVIDEIDFTDVLPSEIKPARKAKTVPPAEGFAIALSALKENPQVTSTELARKLWGIENPEGYSVTRAGKFLEAAKVFSEN